MVCSRGAKRPIDSTDDVRRILASGSQATACVAPSFPAEFTEFEPEVFAGML